MIISTHQARRLMECTEHIQSSTQCGAIAAVIEERGTPPHIILMGFRCLDCGMTTVGEADPLYIPYFPN